MTATSVAISVQVLSYLGKMKTKEGLFLGLLIGSILIVPRILHRGRLWKSQGSIEGVTTAIFLGNAGIAALVGLSPIVGALAIGMAVASTRLIKQVEEYINNLQIIFAPLFFAIIGAQVDLRDINLDVLVIAGILVSIGIGTKIIGCGLPSLFFLKDKDKAMKVGIEMVSRGDIGLNCGRNRCNIRSIIWRCVYCNYCYGGSYNYNNTSMAKKSISERISIDLI